MTKRCYKKRMTEPAMDDSGLVKYTKKSIAIGIGVGAVTMAVVLVNAGKFLAAENYGGLLLAISLIAIVVAAAGIAFKPNRQAGRHRIYVTFVFFVAPLINVICIERLNGNFIGELKNMCYIDNYLMCLMFYLFVFALSGSVRISTLLISPVMLVFGIANMYIKEFRGEPLVPMDVGSVSTAMTVARGYTYDVGVDLSFAIALTVMIMALAVRLSMPICSRYIKVLSRMAILAFVIVVSAGFYKSDLATKWGYKPDFFNQTRGYENRGALFGFLSNTRYMHLAEPDGYDADRVAEIVTKAMEDPGKAPQTILAQVAGTEKGSKQNDKSVRTPDIIVIMDEAFSDLAINGDFTTTDKVLPEMDKLKKESLQGYCYVSVFGSGTSNTEFEFLTGDSMAFLPPGSNAYQLYVDEGQPGVVSKLKEEGYSTHAYHPYFKNNWNRPKVYDYMGFDDYRAVEDMFSDEFVKKYAENPGAVYMLRSQLKKDGYGDDVLLRRYVSDAYDFAEIKELYEERDKSKPYFMFNVTMQNHSPYDLLLAERDRMIKIEGLDGEYKKTDQYLSITRRTDEALGDLVEYFKRSGDPVLIVFFGDHQPAIENEFYEDVTGTSPRDMEGRQKMNRYSTRFMIWANYDIPTGWVEQISINYLGTIMMEAAGLPLTDYNKYLEMLHAKTPVVTAQGVIDADGKFYESANDVPLLADYDFLIYNNVADKEHRADIY